MELNFELKVNSSEFIEKTEQIRSAIQVMATEMESQGKRMSLSFQQMADNVGLTANVLGKVIGNMQERINAAIYKYEISLKYLLVPFISFSFFCSFSSKY